MSWRPGATKNRKPDSIHTLRRIHPSPHFFSEHSSALNPSENFVFGTPKLDGVMTDSQKAFSPTAASLTVKPSHEIEKVLQKAFSPTAASLTVKPSHEIEKVMTDSQKAFSPAAASLTVKPSHEIDITHEERKIYLTEEILKQLCCSFCEKYLSYFPIYIYPDILPQISCGRCPLQNDQNPIHFIIYETIAKFLYFPCCYKPNGCIEQFQPFEISKHEETCSYRQYSCPSYPIGSCKWQGQGTELYTHYEIEHRAFILDKMCQFTIDLTTEHKQNYLMMKNGELFFIHVECDAQEFRGFVSYFINKVNLQNYYYELYFKESNSSVKLNEKMDVAPNMKIDKKSIVCFDTCNTELTNLTSVICSVSISPHLHHGMANMCVVNSNKDETDLEVKLLSELECPCCIEPMIAPIFVCNSGHSICNKCIKKISLCPICNVNLRSNLRNYTLEKIIKHISKYPCKYSVYGCDFVNTPEGKVIHEKSCLYFAYTCPLACGSDCDWKGIHSEILEHAKIKHIEDMINTNTITSIFFDNNGENKQEPDRFIYNFNGNLFRLVFKYEARQLFWSVQFIGPKQPLKFMYIIDLVDCGSDRRLILKQKCATLTKYESVFINEDTYICVPISLLKTFIDEGCITYKFNIMVS